jgi:hypothetical protein
MLLSDYISQVQELIHDSSAIDFTTTELTTFINNARTRVALDFHCVRSFFTNLSSIANQETYPMSGGVGGAIVTNGGTYSSTPTITFDPPGGGGVTATGTAVMTGTAPTMVVSTIAMTNWGSGYTTTPAVTFSAGAAAATAVPLVRVMDFLSITSIFGTQRAMMKWEVFSTFQAFMRSNTTLRSGQPAVWSNYTEANTFYLYPVPDQTYTLEIDAVVLPGLLVLPTDSDLQIIMPMADCVQFYAAHLALIKLQNFGQADYFNKKYEERYQQIQRTRQTRRMQNAYQTMWRRMQRGW